MGAHPINLTVRFLLELIALFVFSLWGYEMAQGWIGYALAILLPILSAVVWGVFAVPNDPSRSGRAPIPVPGIIRLIIELLFFGSAAWALAALGYTWYFRVFASVVVIHYIISYDRILWLLKR